MLSQEVELYRFRVRIERVRLAVMRKQGNGAYMKEIKDITSALQALTTLKQAASSTTAAFSKEAANAQVNISKVTALTQELKDANKALENVLGASGSNFAPEGNSTLSAPDANGVRVNKP